MTGRGELRTVVIIPVVFGRLAERRKQTEHQDAAQDHGDADGGNDRGGDANRQIRGIVLRRGWTSTHLQMPSGVS